MSHFLRNSGKDSHQSEFRNYLYNTPSPKLMLNKLLWKKNLNEWISKWILNYTFSVIRQFFFKSAKYSTWFVYVDEACILLMHMKVMYFPFTYLFIHSRYIYYARHWAKNLRYNPHLQVPYNLADRHK